MCTNWRHFTYRKNEDTSKINKYKFGVQNNNVETGQKEIQSYMDQIFQISLARLKF